MHKLIVPAAALALFSCGIDVGNKEQENPGRPPPGKHPTPPDFPNADPDDIALAGAILENPAPAGTVRPGDRVLIRLSGKILRPRVGGEYVKSVRSRWREEDCWETGRQDDGGYPEEKCIEVPVTGTCEIRYRDFHGMDESPMLFSPADTEPPGIKIAVGENTYRPRKTIRHAPREIVLEFAVTPEMIPDGEAAELVIIPPEPRKGRTETVKYGFMGFGKCPGRTDGSAHGFTHSGHEIQSEHPSTRTEYTVDVVVEPGHHNTKTTNHKGGTTHA